MMRLLNCANVVRLCSALVTWVLVYALATATCNSLGCAAFKKGSLPLTVKDTTVGQRNESTTTVTPGRDLNVGGGTDSIALWLAIVSLAAAAMAYPIHRRIRLWRENGKARNEHGCSVVYSEWGQPSLDPVQQTMLLTSSRNHSETGSGKSS